MFRAVVVAAGFAAVVFVVVVDLAFVVDVVVLAVLVLAVDVYVPVHLISSVLFSECLV